MCSSPRGVGGGNPGKEDTEAILDLLTWVFFFFLNFISGSFARTAGTNELEDAYT